MFSDNLNPTGMSLKNRLIACLQKLKEYDYTDVDKARASDAKAENALNLIYQTALKKTTFTTEEKKIVGSLLFDAITPIQSNIEGTLCEYRTRLDTSVLMKRSAIQFLIDEYGKFPVENSILATKLEEAGIAESVEILNEIINRYCDMSDSDEGSSDRESAGSQEVPRSHIWWTA